MIDTFPVQHCQHDCSRSFEETVAAFEAATGSIGSEEWKQTVRNAASEADFVARVQAFEGESGFMRFLTLDHGAWLHHYGRRVKARAYVLGNPLIAWTMIQHDLGVGLNVPVRAQIREDADGKVCLEYDLPSSLMKRLGNADVDAAALRLDEKLRALVERVAGAAA